MLFEMLDFTSAAFHLSATSIVAGPATLFWFLSPRGICTIDTVFIRFIDSSTSPPAESRLCSTNDGRTCVPERSRSVARGQTEHPDQKHRPTPCSTALREPGSFRDVRE